MTPDEMSERLAAWAATTRHIEDCGGGSLAVHELEDRRVICVEPDGPRRTWCLWEGSRQVGHVRMRADVIAWDPYGSPRLYGDRWTVEASDRTRRLLGLDGAAESGQTGAEEASR